MVWVPLSIKGVPCSLGGPWNHPWFLRVVHSQTPNGLPLSQVSSSLHAASHLGLSISALSSLELKKKQRVPWLFAGCHCKGLDIAGYIGYIRKFQMVGRISSWWFQIFFDVPIFFQVGWWKTTKQVLELFPESHRTWCKSKFFFNPPWNKHQFARRKLMLAALMALFFRGGLLVLGRVAVCPWKEAASPQKSKPDQSSNHHFSGASCPTSGALCQLPLWEGSIPSWELAYPLPRPFWRWF